MNNFAGKYQYITHRTYNYLNFFSAVILMNKKSDWIIKAIIRGRSIIWTTFWLTTIWISITRLMAQITSIPIIAYWFAIMRRIVWSWHHQLLLLRLLHLLCKVCIFMWNNVMFCRKKSILLRSWYSIYIYDFKNRYIITSFKRKSKSLRTISKQNTKQHTTWSQFSRKRSTNNHGRNAIGKTY